MRNYKVENTEREVNTTGRDINEVNRIQSLMKPPGEINRIENFEKKGLKIINGKARRQNPKIEKKKNRRIQSLMNPWRETKKRNRKL